MSAGESLPQSAHVPGTPAASSPPPCEDLRNAGPLVGKSGCVAGLVLRVYSARTGNTFLDFCQDYRTCPFTSVIFASDKSKFGDLESLQGKRVEIRGDVVTYQGHAEIIIHDPQQVRSAP
jgi:DNA/RNA endonuclease YhcR with UshA esterase domain